MLAIALIAVLVGYAAGRLHADALHWHRPHRSAHDLRHVRPAREHDAPVTGVRLVDPRPRMSEPPAFLPDVEAFDEEHTR